MTNSKSRQPQANLYANKASLVLYWLLTKGTNAAQFTIRQVAKEQQLSVGLVQRVFSTLISQGIVGTCGVRTAKTFFLKDPSLLLSNWVHAYDILKRCRVHTYHSPFRDRSELLQLLSQSKLRSGVVAALHTAAASLGYQNTNLETVELYLLNPNQRLELEQLLRLSPQDRGYDLLLIEPYYKAILNSSADEIDALRVSPSLLTYLDLYHYPLRGREQAEHLAHTVESIKQIAGKEWKKRMR